MKYEDKKSSDMMPLASVADEMQQLQPKARGRKPKIKIMEEQNALDELRKKRKRLVTILH